MSRGGFGWYGERYRSHDLCEGTESPKFSSSEQKSTYRSYIDPKDGPYFQLADLIYKLHTEYLVLLLLKGLGSQGPIALRALEESHVTNSNYGCSLRGYDHMDILCTHEIEGSEHY